MTQNATQTDFEQADLIEATDTLRDHLSQIERRSDLFLVLLRRYDEPQPAYGLHVVYPNPDRVVDPGWYHHHTIGLYGRDRGLAFVKVFAELYGAFGLFPLYRSAGLDDYIRGNVIPLEWKSLNDVELNNRLQVSYGRNA